MRRLTPLDLVSLAVNEGETTPVPVDGAGSLAWSTVLSKPVYFDGTQWTANFSTATTAMTRGQNYAAALNDNGIF